MPTTPSGVRPGRHASAGSHWRDPAIGVGRARAPALVDAGFADAALTGVSARSTARASSTGESKSCRVDPGWQTPTPGSKPQTAEPEWALLFVTAGLGANGVLDACDGDAQTDACLALGRRLAIAAERDDWGRRIRFGIRHDVGLNIGWGIGWGIGFGVRFDVWGSLDTPGGRH